MKRVLATPLALALALSLPAVAQAVERAATAPVLAAKMFAVAPAKVQMVQIGEFSANATTVPRGYCPNSEAGIRRQVRQVTFSPAFSSPPHVAISINSLDSPGDASDARNVRYSVSAQGVTVAGATVVIQTWCDTDIWQLSGSLIAVGDK